MSEERRRVGRKEEASKTKGTEKRDECVRNGVGRENGRKVGGREQWWKKGSRLLSNV